jgi:hypothetical protein
MKSIFDEVCVFTPQEFMTGKGILRTLKQVGKRFTRLLTKAS